MTNVHDRSDTIILHGDQGERIAVSVCGTDAPLSPRSEDGGIGIPSANKRRLFSQCFGKTTCYGFFPIRGILSAGMTVDETRESGTRARFSVHASGSNDRLVHPADSVARGSPYGGESPV